MQFARWCVEEKGYHWITPLWWGIKNFTRYALIQHAVCAIKGHDLISYQLPGSTPVESDDDFEWPTHFCLRCTDNFYEGEEM